METVAYHESGHAYIAMQVGARVRSVTIEPDDDDDGPRRSGDTQVIWKRGKFSQREFLEKSAMVALAGPVAEMIYTGDPFHPGTVAEWAADWEDAQRAIESLQPDPALRIALLENLTLQLYRTLSQDQHWAGLAALADHLLAHETLDAEQIRDILDNWRC